MRYAGAGLLLCLLALWGCGGGSSSTSQAQSSGETQQGQTAKSAPKEENAEESIEGYGSEAGGSDRAALLSTFHGYLGALAEGDEQKACSYLADNVRQSLQQLAAKAKKSLSCPQLLEALLSPQADRIAKVQAEGKVTKVRIKGNTAFLVFHAPGARLYQLTLAKEGNEWKTTTLSAAVLAPSVPHQ